MRFLFIALTLFVLAPTSRALAQRTIAQDTMSETTPVALTCGFCAMEAYGVVFREVGAGGLTAADFPLTLRTVSLALADADVSADGSTCTGRSAGGSALVHVEIWSGATPPTGDPRTFPVLGEPWAGEELVYAADDVPVTLSVPTAEGATGFNLMLNEFAVLGESDEPIVVAEGNTYLRVAVGLNGEGTHNAICADPLEAPSGFPVRDDEGRVAPERGFIYAGGYGWAWNEDLPGPGSIEGDWGIRLSISPMGTTRDAGPRVDASVATDAAAADGGVDAASGAIDGGTTAGGGGACSCRMAGSRASGSSLWLLALVALVVARRRATR